MIEVLIGCCIVLWCIAVILAASTTAFCAVIGALAAVEMAVRTLVQRHRAPRRAPGGLRSTGRRLGAPQNRHQRRAESRDAVRAQAALTRDRTLR